MLAPHCKRCFFFFLIFENPQGDFVSKRLKNYNGVRDAAMKEVKDSDVGQMLVTKGEKIDQWLIETIGVAQTRTGKMSYQLENVKVW